MDLAGLAVLFPCALWVVGVWSGWHRQERWLMGFLVVAALGGAVHVALNAFRWQLVPAYTLALSACTSAALRLGHPAPMKSSPWRRAFGGIGLACGLAIAVVLPGWLFPEVRYDKPTGPYPVGTRGEYWVDSARTDPFRAGGGPRRLLVDIWYPADPGPKAERARNHPAPDALAKGLAASQGGRLPAFLFSSLGRGLSWAYPGQPVTGADRSFPLLVFSHGFGGSRFQNGFQMAELASHGYVVASVEHVGNAVGSVFPDGAVINMDPAASKPLLGDSVATRFADIWAADGEFVIDRMVGLARSDPRQMLTGRIDTLHIGYFGHSFGGATAANVMAIDHRVLAGVNMDGYLAGTAWVKGLDRPFLQFRSDPMDYSNLPEEQIKTAGITRESLRELVAEWDRRSEKVLAGGGLELHVRGTMHLNYSDDPLWSPILARRLRLAGPIDPRRAHAIINTVTLAFFDRYLKGKAGPLLDAPARAFPELEVTRPIGARPSSAPAIR